MKTIPSRLDQHDMQYVIKRITATRKIPYSGNIKVEISDNDIILKKDSGETMSISSLLPDNFILHGKYGGRFLCNILPRLLGKGPAQVEYPKESTDKADFLIKLLHEIGHAWDENIKNAESISYQELRTLKGWSTKIFPRIVKQLVAMLLDRTIKKHYSTEDISKTKKYERFAWSFALRKYRELKKEGWDLSGGLSNEQIGNLARDSLLSYEGRNMDRFPWGEQKYISMTRRARGNIHNYSNH